MRLFFSLLVGKALYFVGKKVGRSTNLPGQIALKICPDLLKRLNVSGKVIAITGSNGKTTTANLVAHLLRDAGYKVVNNREGSNLASGCATTMLDSANFKGEIVADFLVLEVDERYSAIIFRDLKLDYFYINNLFRDQVARNGNPDIVWEKINAAVQPNTVLILNGNDPITAGIHPENKRVYFAMGETAYSTKTNDMLTNDCKICPRCGVKLDYDFYHYNHIGQFHCPSCGFGTPQADFVAANVDMANSTYTINGKVATVAYNPFFYFMNATGAVATAVTAGADFDSAIASLAQFQVSRDRYETFDVDGRHHTLILTKQNSVSLDQSIAYTLEQSGDKTVVLYVNNVIYTDNKDVSWIYDVTFERMLGKISSVVCAGNRAYDTAVRLMLAGFDQSQLVVVDDLSQCKSAVATTVGDVYVLAASAFGNEDGIYDALLGK